MTNRVLRTAVAALLVSVLGAAVASAQAAGPNVNLSPDPLAGTHARGKLQAEPDLAIDPNDPQHLVAAVQEGRFHSGGGALAIAFATSTDGGSTWATGLLPGLTDASGGTYDRASDPVAAVGPDGTAYVASLLFNEDNPDTAIAVSRSSDGGITWPEPVAVATTDDPSSFWDKEWIVADPVDGSLYVAWKDFTGFGDGGPMLLSRSTDGGDTWSTPRSITPNHNAFAAQPLVLPNGRLAVVYSVHREKIRIIRSRDGGQTFGRARAVAVMQPSVLAGLRTGDGLPSATVDPVTGVIHVAWQDGRRDASDVSSVRSTDGGRTWTEPRRVNRSPRGEAQFLPDVSASGSVVHVFYYDGTDDASDADLFTFSYSRSVDGGANFGAPVVVGDTSFPASAAASTTQGLMFGDYIGSAAGPAGAYAVWIDTRDGQPDMYTAGVGP